MYFTNSNLNSEEDRVTIV